AGRRKAAEYREIVRPHNPPEAPLRDRRDLPAPSISAVLSGIAPSQAAKSLIYFMFLPHSRFKNSGISARNSGGNSVIPATYSKLSEIWFQQIAMHTSVDILSISR